MPSKFGTLGEGFPTLVTLKGLFSSVCSLVYNKLRTTAERFSTLTACMWPLSSLNDVTASKRRGYMEGIMFLPTPKWCFSTITYSSLYEAVITLILTFSKMHRLMFIPSLAMIDDVSIVWTVIVVLC